MAMADHLLVELGMGDFQKKLDELATKKAAAEAEKRRAEKEIAERHRAYTSEMNELIKSAFDQPLKDLMSKADALGIEASLGEQHHSGMTLRLKTKPFPTHSFTLMVLPRGEKEGIEVVFSPGNGSSQNQKVKPNQMDQQWAEQLLLTSVERCLGMA